MKRLLTFGVFVVLLVVLTAWIAASPGVGALAPRFVPGALATLPAYNWDHYDCTHVVFKPTLMTPEQLSEGVHWLWRNTLSHSSIWKRLYGGPQFMFYLGMNYAMKMLDKKIHPKCSKNPACG